MGPLFRHRLGFFTCIRNADVCLSSQVHRQQCSILFVSISVYFSLLNQLMWLGMVLVFQSFFLLGSRMLVLPWTPAHGILWQQCCSLRPSTAHRPILWRCVCEEVHGPVSAVRVFLSMSYVGVLWKKTDRWAGDDSMRQPATVQVTCFIFAFIVSGFPFYSLHLTLDVLCVF